MAAGTVANSDTFRVTTPSDCEITLTRLFDASRRLVFEAMTRPEHVKRWWDLTVCEIDLRPGGAWRFAGRSPKGGEYARLTVTARYPSKEVRDWCSRAAWRRARRSSTTGSRKWQGSWRWPASLTKDEKQGDRA